MNDKKETIYEISLNIDDSKLLELSPHLKELVELFNQLAQEITVTVKMDADSLYDSINECISKTETFVSLIVGMETIGSLIAKAMGKDIFDILGKSKDKAAKDAEQMANGIVKELSECEGELRRVGKNIGEGLSEGMKSTFEDLKSWSMEMTIEIIDAINKGFDCHSPSKKTEEIGSNVGKGLKIGMSNSSKEAIKAAGDMCDEIVDSMDGLKDAAKAGKSYEKAMEGVADSSKDLAKAVETSTDGLGEGFNDAKKSAKKFGDTVEEAGNKKISFGSAFAVVAAIVGTLVEFFKNLMESNEEFGAKVDEVWGKVTEAFAPVTEAVMGLFSSFAEGGEGLGGSMDVIMEIINGASEMIIGVISWISDFFAQNGDAIMAVVSAIWEFISPIITLLGELVGDVLTFVMGLFTGNGEEIKEGAKGIWDSISGILDFALGFVSDIFSQIWEKISDIFSGVGEFFAEKFNEGWEAVKNAFSGCVNFFSNIWSRIKKLFTKIGTAIGSGISGAFKSVVNGVISFASKIINGFISSINTAIKTINKLPGVSIPVLAKISLPKLEMGGLVNPGQMFIAREAGPELVASFGSKTAVMNNNQIVEAVSNGVYRAVAMAMGSMGLPSLVSLTAFLLSEKKSYKRKPTLAEGLRRITSLRFAARLLGVAFA